MQRSSCGALAFALLLLDACTRPPARPAPAPRSVSGVSRPRPAATALPGPYSPVLASFVGERSYRDAAGQSWSLADQGKQLALKRTPELDGQRPWLQGTPFEYQLRQNGQVFAKGVITDGTPRVVVDLSEPQRVEGLDGVRALSTGSGGTCALLEGGKLRCFRDDTVEQEGEEYAPIGFSRSKFVTLADSGVVKVADDCFLRGGRISCYRLVQNQSGEVALPKEYQRTIPLENVTDFCVHSSSLGCARVGDDLWCFGRDAPNAESLPAGADPATPRRALPGEAVESLQCKEYAVTVRTRTGALWSYYGLPSKFQPPVGFVREEHFPTVTSFQLTLDGLCALDSQGGLRCCGFFFGRIKVGVGRAGVNCDPALLNARPSTP